MRQYHCDGGGRATRFPQRAATMHANGCANILRINFRSTTS
jgi:hypothetical protein